MSVIHLHLTFFFQYKKVKMFSRFFAYVFFERLSYVPSWLDLIIENSPLQSFPIEFIDFLVAEKK